MSSSSVTFSHICNGCGRDEWLFLTEQVLSASSIGWFLQALLKEHAKSTTIAYLGSASTVYLADMCLRRLSMRPPNNKLLRSGVLLSVVGVTFYTNMALEEHSQAVVKACLAGALSFCLGKAVVSEYPSLEVRKKRRRSRKTTESTDTTETTEEYNYFPTFQVMPHKSAEYVGKMLKELAHEFFVLKFE